MVWGTNCEGADCYNVVWGTAQDGDNVVWGTFDTGDNVVWGTSESSGDNVVWGTSSGSSVQVYLPITGDVADEFSWQALFHPPSVLDAGYDVLVPFYRQWFIPFNPPTMSALPPSDIMVNQTTAGGL